MGDTKEDKEETEEVRNGVTRKKEGRSATPKAKDAPVAKDTTAGDASPNDTTEGTSEGTSEAKDESQPRVSSKRSSMRFFFVIGSVFVLAVAVLANWIDSPVAGAAKSTKKKNQKKSKPKAPYPGPVDAADLASTHSRRRETSVPSPSSPSPVPTYQSDRFMYFEGEYWMTLFENNVSEKYEVLNADLFPGAEGRKPDAELMKNGEFRTIDLRVPEAESGTVRLTVASGPRFFEDGEIGNSVWPAALAGAAWMTRIGGKLKGSILELGSGVGVFGLSAGVVAGSFAPKDGSLGTLMLSDYIPYLVQNLQADIADNSPLLSSFASADAVMLDWEKALEPDFEPHALYDHIIAADCVYSPIMVPMLVATIVKHLKPGGRFYSVQPLPRTGWKKLRKSLRKHGTVAVAPGELRHNWDYENGRAPPTPHKIEAVIFEKK